jgi:hypothetical protein
VILCWAFMSDTEVVLAFELSQAMAPVSGHRTAGCRTPEQCRATRTPAEFHVTYVAFSEAVITPAEADARPGRDVLVPYAYQRQLADEPPLPSRAEIDACVARSRRGCQRASAGHVGRAPRLGGHLLDPSQDTVKVWRMLDRK